MHAIAVVFNSRDMVAQAHLVAHLDDTIATHFPHLTRSETRVLELVDQGLDVFDRLLSDAAARIALLERKILDALRRPFGANFGAREDPRPFPCRS